MIFGFGKLLECPCLCGVGCAMVTVFTRFDGTPACDRQTDGQTERWHKRWFTGPIINLISSQLNRTLLRSKILRSGLCLV